MRFNVVYSLNVSFLSTGKITQLSFHVYSNIGNVLTIKTTAFNE